MTSEYKYLGGLTMVELTAAQRRSDAEFFALAKAAHGVMLRRGWGVDCTTTADGVRHWCAVSESGERLLSGGFSPDPFTALVAADSSVKRQESRQG